MESWAYDCAPRNTSPHVYTVLRESTPHTCSKGCTCFRVWHAAGIPSTLALSPPPGDHVTCEWARRNAGSPRSLRGEQTSEGQPAPVLPAGGCGSQSNSTALPSSARSPTSPPTKKAGAAPQGPQTRVHSHQHACPRCSGSPQRARLGGNPVPSTAPPNKAFKDARGT